MATGQHRWKLASADGCSEPDPTWTRRETRGSGGGWAPGAETEAEADGPSRQGPRLKSGEQQGCTTYAGGVWEAREALPRADGGVMGSMAPAQGRRRRLRALPPPPSGAPLTRPSRGRRCWEPPSIFARIMQLGSLAPSLAAWRRASRFHPRPSCSGLNFSRFALAIPTPAGAGLGTAKLPRPMSVLWGGLGGGMDGGEIHTTPYPCLPCLSTAQSRPIIPIELHNCGPPYGGVRQRAGIMFLFNLGSLSTSSLWSPLSSVHQQHHLQPRLSPVLVHHTYH